MADDAARKRALKRAANLLARANDKSNANEAVLARQRLDELVAKWGFDERELEAFGKARPRPRKAADAGGWREILAAEIGRKYGCKALKAEGSIYFEGDKALEAIATLRRVAADLERRAPLAWAVLGHPDKGTMKAAYYDIFFMAAVYALAVPDARPNHRAIPKTEATVKSRREDELFNSFLIYSANELGHNAGRIVGQGEEQTAVQSAEPPPPGRYGNETFAMVPGVVAVRSNYPGNYATLFLPDGTKHYITGDLCRFDDKKEDYVWVFRCSPPDGPVVFATAKRAAVAEVMNGLIQGTGHEAKMDRNVDGESLRVIEIIKGRRYL